ncbi:MAG: hypothetical protein AAGJ81_15975 [Verrucomicrobiota bacterium]
MKTLLAIVAALTATAFIGAILTFSDLPAESLMIFWLTYVLATLIAIGRFIHELILHYRASKIPQLKP